MAAAQLIECLPRCMESLALSLGPHKPGFLTLTCNPRPWDDQKFKVILSLRPAWIMWDLICLGHRTQIILAGLNLKPPSCSLAPRVPDRIMQVAKGGEQLKVLFSCDT